MRVLLAGLLVAACVTTTAELPPPARLLGCWASSDGMTTRMRWTAPDASNPNSLRGRKTELRLGSTERLYYALDPDGDGFVFCELTDEQGASGRCFQVAQGQQGSLEGGRAFIDLAGSRLRVSIVGDGPERIIFSGQRESCR